MVNGQLHFVEQQPSRRFVFRHGGVGDGGLHARWQVSEALHYAADGLGNGLDPFAQLRRLGILGQPWQIIEPIAGVGEMR